MDTAPQIPAMSAEPRPVFGPLHGMKASPAASGAERAAPAWPHTQIAALPDWDDLRLLLSVVGEGSLGRSARALGLTQPTMSRRIRRLETDLGTALLRRSSRGVTLTHHAHLIVEELKAAHAAIARAIGRAGAPGGLEIRLVTTDSLAALWLPRFLAGFIARHPDVDLRIFSAADPQDGEVGHYDIAVHDAPPREPSLMTMRLGTFHFMPYASRLYVERHGRPDSQAALGAHHLLDSAARLVDCGSWMGRTGGDALRARFFTNSAASLAQAVLSGAGIALLPTYAAVFEPELVPLEIGLHFARPFWLSYRREMPPKAAAEVLPFVKQVLNRRAMPWFGDSFAGGQFARAAKILDAVETR